MSGVDTPQKRKSGTQLLRLPLLKVNISVDLANCQCRTTEWILPDSELHRVRVPSCSC